MGQNSGTLSDDVYVVLYISVLMYFKFNIFPMNKTDTKENIILHNRLTNDNRFDTVGIPYVFPVSSNELLES